ncbi:MAG: molybdopterin-binding protein, partial [Mesorhizobium sp.]
MKFGPLSIDEAEGAILAHATIVGERKLKKSHRLTRDDVADLKASGVEQVIVAKLADDDLDENIAASRVAQALSISGAVLKPAATGRVNIHALKSGVFTVNRAVIDAVNRIDPAITLATLMPYAAVVEGQMVATVKIIPFAVPGEIVDAAVEVAARQPAMAIHPFNARSVGVVQTVLPSVKPSVLDKTVQITGARLSRSGGRVGEEMRVPHRQDAVREAVAALLPRHDMVIVFGASAMSDPGDVIPAAIRDAGGDVIRAGMPVDPGNLIVIGDIGGKPVLGAPGCARSPKENGFDWVLDRLMAGLPVTADDVASMGVGGLLMEIATRPQPRDT